MKKLLMIMGIAVLAVLLVIVFTGFTEKGTEKTNQPSSGIENESSELFPEWHFVELSDVRTGEKFAINDFFSKPILLESFAVWCPTCTSQQREIKKLHQEVGDSVISISLDTDPNEDEAIVLSHIEENGFDWRYAVSPIQMTQALIAEFGNSIVNAPSAPVVLICEDGSYRRLGSGVKRVDELKEEISKGC